MPFNWAGSGMTEEVAVTVTDQASLLADLSKRLEAGDGFSLATLNLDHAAKLARDKSFVSAYASHTHVTADGNPVVWLSRLAGQSNVRLVPGSELINPMVALASSLSVPVAFVGATEATLRAAAAELQLRHNRLNVTLTFSPPMDFDPSGPDADLAITAIRASGARLVFLALGAPKQECFATRAQDALPYAGFLSIGAGLDFVAGSQKRAPVWVRVLAAEWLWRLLSNPARLAPRYAACLAILPHLTLRAVAARLKKRSDA